MFFPGGVPLLFIAFQCKWKLLVTIRIVFPLSKIGWEDIWWEMPPVKQMISSNSATRILQGSLLFSWLSLPPSLPPLNHPWAPTLPLTLEVPQPPHLPLYQLPELQRHDFEPVRLGQREIGQIKLPGWLSARKQKVIKPTCFFSVRRPALAWNKNVDKKMHCNVGTKIAEVLLFVNPFLAKLPKTAPVSTFNTSGQISKYIGDHFAFSEILTLFFVIRSSMTFF